MIDVPEDVASRVRTFINTLVQKIGDDEQKLNSIRKRLLDERREQFAFLDENSPYYPYFRRNFDEALHPPPLEQAEQPEISLGQRDSAVSVGDRHTRRFVDQDLLRFRHIIVPPPNIPPDLLALCRLTARWSALKGRGFIERANASGRLLSPWLQPNEPLHSYFVAMEYSYTAILELLRGESDIELGPYSMPSQSSSLGAETDEASRRTYIRACDWALPRMTTITASSTSTVSAGAIDWWDHTVVAKVDFSGLTAVQIEALPRPDWLPPPPDLLVSRGVAAAMARGEDVPTVEPEKPEFSALQDPLRRCPVCLRMIPLSEMRAHLHDELYNPRNATIETAREAERARLGLDRTDDRLAYDVSEAAKKTGL